MNLKNIMLSRYRQTQEYILSYSIFIRSGTGKDDPSDYRNQTKSFLSERDTDWEVA